MDDTPFSSAEEDDNALSKRDAPTDADPYNFGAAEAALNDAARRVNGLWISFILLCVYIFIATFTVTPAALFRDAPVKLPIFNAELPLKVYFVMAPILVLALHAYLIVLTKGLTKKIDAYEDVLKRSVKIASGRRALRARLDDSITMRAMGLRYHDALGDVVFASNFIAEWTMVVLPVALLLLTQLVFLPRQEESLTWVHRFFISVSIIMCLWLFHKPFNTLKRLNIEGRSMVSFIRLWIAVGQFMIIAFVSFAWVTSVCLAAFPGEWIYAKLYEHWPHDLTIKYFEGPPDPIDYVHRGGVLPFPNRLILPDDPKLAENAGASSGGVSLSVRGRNFRKAVFDRSNLARVDFSAADLTEASLQSAKLEGAKFECGTPGQIISEPLDSTGDAEREEDRDCTKLERANLWNANLDNASLREARMNNARLGRASLKGALFRKARMNGTILQAAALDSANFSGAELLGADFDWARGINVNFSKTRLTAANFRQARLLAANFTRAMLQGAYLFEADLIAANFTGARMLAVDLRNASLQAASFLGATLPNATLDAATIKGASFVYASLQGASLKCVAPFRTDFGNVEQAFSQAFSEKVEKKNPGAKLLETIVNYQTVKCAEPERDSYSYFDWDVPDPYDLLDRKVATSWGTDYYTPTPDIYTQPEKLDAKTFERQLNDYVLSGLPNELAKMNVRLAFERLKPGARTTAQDEAEKAFWADWAKKSAPQESHDKALAERLESIACVADGAPHVARGLLWARRFDRLYQDKETNEKEKNRILERFKKAASGGDPTCLGAKGLVVADFPKPAS